jgi:hypothetical protein
MTPQFKPVKSTILLTCLLTVLFLTFFNASKHCPALAEISPFIEDPYDAVGSFGIQLAFLSALISLVRIFRPYPHSMASNNLALILHGAAVSLAAIVVTLTADMIAMLRYLPDWIGSFTGWLLVAVIGGFMVLTAWVWRMIVRTGQSLNLLSGCHSRGQTLLICLGGLIILTFYPEAWRQDIPGGILTALVGMVILLICSLVMVKSVFPPVGEQYEDFLDDLLALYRWLEAQAHDASFLFSQMEKLARISWMRAFINGLNPRQHSWNFVILVALGMGIALVIVEAIGEGAPDPGAMLMVLTVFIGIEGVGVSLGYALYRRFLGIFRS